MGAEKNILIVGAGLSGLCLARHFLEEKWRVTLVDNGVNHSSAIAAGMVNPLVFRRMNKSWRVDEFSPYLKDFYDKIENECGKPIYRPITIRRMFSNEHERELWLDKQEQEDYANYMTKTTPKDDAFDKVINNFGSGRVKNAGWVDTAVFLAETKKLIKKNGGQLIDESFDYKDLHHLSYNDVEYSDVVFCEGYLGKHNPWFGDLPLNQTKGDTLDIRSEKIPEDESVNRKCFILPLGNKTFKVGSTYHWHNDDPTPTEEGKNMILDKMSYLVDEEFEILDHAAGVRPTTYDRRPLIGTHPEHPYYHIFNGLGTKGYMLAPLLCKEFTDYLKGEGELNEEVNISRVYPGR
jgi:glycine/D-amino acid oxidase-like deaminating enzyme